MKKQILILALAIFSFSTLCKAQIKIFNGGWVSIGTTAAPLYSFHQIMGGIAFPKTSSGITSAAYIRGNNSYSFASSPDYTWAGNDQCGMFHPASNTIGFCTSNSRKVTIDSYGNFGIADSTPYSLFTVGNGDLFQVTSSGYVRSVNGSAATPTYSFTGNTDIGMYNNSGHLSFATGGGERLRVSSSGYIQLGANGTASTPILSWISDNNTGLFTPGSDIIALSTAGTERMRIDASGYAAIGASTVSGIRLYTYGGINRFAYSSTINFEFWNGDPRIYSPTDLVVFYNSVGSNYVDVKARSFIVGSDQSLKTNITNISDGIDVINQLRGVSYNWIGDSPTSPKSYGFIAQEVEQVIPDIVFTDDSIQLKSVNYLGIIPYLVEAIKEQLITIKEQGDRINILETDLAQCCTASTPANKSLQLPNNSGHNENNNSGSPALYQNIPNPFNSKTDIGYYLPNETTNASLLIFDMQGKLIKTCKINTFGKGNIEINAGELQPGMYMYSLISNGKEIDTKKMILTE